MDVSPVEISELISLVTSGESRAVDRTCQAFAASLEGPLTVTTGKVLALNPAHEHPLFLQTAKAINTILEWNPAVWAPWVYARVPEFVHVSVANACMGVPRSSPPFVAATTLLLNLGEDATVRASLQKVLRPVVAARLVDLFSIVMAADPSKRVGTKVFESAFVKFVAVFGLDVPTHRGLKTWEHLEPMATFWALIAEFASDPRTAPDMPTVGVFVRMLALCPDVATMDNIWCSFPALIVRIAGVLEAGEDTPSNAQRLLLLAVLKSTWQSRVSVVEVLAPILVPALVKVLDRTPLTTEGMTMAAKTSIDLLFSMGKTQTMAVFRAAIGYPDVFFVLNKWYGFPDQALNKHAVRVLEVMMRGIAATPEEATKVAPEVWEAIFATAWTVGATFEEETALVLLRRILRVVKDAAVLNRVLTRHGVVDRLCARVIACGDKAVTPFAMLQQARPKGTTSRSPVAVLNILETALDLLVRIRNHILGPTVFDTLDAYVAHVPQLARTLARVVVFTLPNTHLYSFSYWIVNALAPQYLEPSAILAARITEFVESLPVRESSGEGTCFCYSDEPPSTSEVVLACGHSFHASCFRMWLTRGQFCPTCRRDVLGEAMGGLVLYEYEEVDVDVDLV